MSEIKSNIPYCFCPIPHEFLIDEFLDDPLMMRLIRYIFKRIRTKPHTEKIKSNGWKTINLEAFEFIFGREKCEKETGLTPREIRTRMGILTTSSFVRKSTSRTTSSFTVYILVTESFSKIRDQQNDQQNDQQFDHKAEEVNALDISLKKESIKEKRKLPASSLLSFTKDQVEGISIYCQAKGIPVEDKTIVGWLKKKSADVIIANITLMLQRIEKRGQTFSIALLSSAIKDDYAGEPERILINRNFAINHQRNTGWQSLIITQQYCKCNITGDSLPFKLNPETFENALLKIYETRMENFG